MLFRSIFIFKKVLFNPKNPRSYAEKSFDQIPYRQLPGILPNDFIKGAKAYKISYKTPAISWDSNAYSYTRIGNPVINDNQLLISSVFCYVSIDFNGTWVRLSSEGSSVSNKEAYYNLDQKGSWQKLIINPECEDGEVPVYMFLAKYNTLDFDSLKGYVLFSYPKVDVKENKLVP